MKEKNPMPIRKFSLIGIIALALIILSLVCELFSFSDNNITKIQTYLVLALQIAGNILLGISLLGYFMNLKENKILKWTSLFIGIFYLLNFFSINNLFTLFTDEFGLLEYFSHSPLFVIYSLLISVALIFFGYAFVKLGKSNRWIGFFAVLFIASSIYVTATNLVTTQVTSLLNQVNMEINPVIIRDMLAKYQFINIFSYVSLLAIFIILFVNQKGIYAKTFKVKVENLIDETE